MTKIEVLTFNHFEVNTTILWNEKKECVLIDAACTKEEEPILVKFIEDHELTPVKILVTHAHADHLQGLLFVCKKYHLPVTLHKEAYQLFKDAENHGAMLGFDVKGISGIKAEFVEDGDIIKFGGSSLKTLYCPGHARGSVCFLSEELKTVIAGDVLFSRSIGRTDLQGGNYDLLINSIKTKLLTLENSYTVIPGHGPATTIGDEKLYNPFLN